MREATVEDRGSRIEDSNPRPAIFHLRSSILDPLYCFISFRFDKSVVDKFSQVRLLELRRRLDETFAQRLQSFERRVGRTGNRRVVLPVAAFENPVFAADVFS